MPAGDLSVSLFKSTAECCTASISWLSEAACVAASADATAAQGSNITSLYDLFILLREDCHELAVA